MLTAQPSSPTSARPDRSGTWVEVEEDVSAVPVGTTVHLCLAALPCKTDVVGLAGSSDTQYIALPLPVGVTAKAADGWPLHVYARAFRRIYRDSTRVMYHASIDPPCHCAGDYAYVDPRLVP
jgi:hypothetical protein